jgi:endonuclease-3
LKSLRLSDEITQAKHRSRSGAEIVGRLGTYIKVERDEFAVLDVTRNRRDPFHLLVATILTQNTSDRNAMRAFRQLSESIGISPERIARAPLSRIRRAIKPAGLFNTRARGLQELSRVVLREYRGYLNWIRTRPLDEARRMMLELPNVGPKTADVLLLFLAHGRTFPIDTHIERISKRLGIVGEKAGYEEIRMKLMRVFPRNSYLKAHLLLIGHGRRTCKARRPLCGSCVLRGMCPFPAQHPDISGIVKTFRPSLKGELGNG